MLAAALGLPGDAALHDRVYGRVLDKLRSEPVEDYRIDFEDGYGNRSDDEEDGHARSTAAALGAAVAAGADLPPFIGIRIKPLTTELHRRSLRTLDLFVTTVAEAAGRLPNGFTVTLPKVQHPDQVAVTAEALGLLETGLGLRQGELRLELMVETTQTIVGSDGHLVLRRMVDAGAGRVVGAHFGVYDYTASCQITAAHQALDHPACDFARHVQQVSLAGTGVWLSDGGTNVLPVPPHAGTDLTPAQRDENRVAIHDAWRLHASHVRHSLVHGYYQGWDLHPAQLPSRFAVVYAFFLEGFEAAAARMRTLAEAAARATMSGDVFDDAATGIGLRTYIRRAINCGAVTEAEVAARTGLPSPNVGA